MRDDIKAAACFVFVGCASEYSLGALYRQHGARPADIEIDEAKEDAVAALKKAREADAFRVLLTSQRMHFGEVCGEASVVELAIFGCALESHALLEPHFSVAAPHDLLDQIYADEAPLLRAFDLYLAATEEALCLSPYCSCRNQRLGRNSMLWKMFRWS